MIRPTWASPKSIEKMTIMALLIFEILIELFNYNM